MADHERRYLSVQGGKDRRATRRNRAGYAQHVRWIDRGYGYFIGLDLRRAKTGQLLEAYQQENRRESARRRYAMSVGMPVRTIDELADMERRLRVEATGQIQKLIDGKGGELKPAVSRFLDRDRADAEALWVAREMARYAYGSENITPSRVAGFLNGSGSASLTPAERERFKRKLKKIDIVDAATAGDDNAV
jgi:hypothetical protein